jgi:hypothetical protein
MTKLTFVFTEEMSKRGKSRFRILGKNKLMKSKARDIIIFTHPAN